MIPQTAVVAPLLASQNDCRPAVAGYLIILDYSNPIPP